MASGCPVEDSHHGCAVDSPCADSLLVVGSNCNEPIEPSQQHFGSTGGSPQPDAVSGGFSSCLRCLATVMPAGGLLATGFAMASTVIGAGVLGLPAAYADVGYIMGTLYLVLITAETVYSMRIVVVVAEKTGLRSYEDMSRVLLHPKAVYLVVALRFVHSLGAQIAYVVTIGDLLGPLLDDTSAPDFLKEKWGLRLLTIAVWLVLFLPVALPREVNALRYVSTVGLAMIIFFCFCIMIHSGMSDSRPPLKAVATGNNAVGGLGVFIFSYMCQVNVMDCVREMTNCTLRRFTLCAVVSMAVCGTLYFLTGLFGYLEFGAAVDGSILEMFEPMKEKQFLLSYIGVLIKICASYGLLSNAARSAVYSVIGWDPLTVAFWKHATFAASMAVTSLIAGLFIPKVVMVLGFTGGVCGGFIAFIFPALFYMYSGKWTPRSVGITNYTSTYLVLIAGVLAVVFGTGSTIYDAIPSSESNIIPDAAGGY